MADYKLDQESRSEEIKQNLLAVKNRIQTACWEADRDSESVTLIVVTKTYPWEDLRILTQLGEMEFGENRVQELVAKMKEAETENVPVHWHQIGTLQKNKVKYLIGKTKLIHSVHSLALAEEISRRALQNDWEADILLQVNVTNEDSKHGFTPRELLAQLSEIENLQGLRLRGLMTMAEFDADEARLRETFESTRALQIEAQNFLSGSKGDLFSCLSMGMSGDFEVAVHCGATHLRIGSAVLGQRVSKEIG